MRSPEDLDRAEPTRTAPLKTHRRQRRRTDIVSEAMRIDPALRQAISPDELDGIPL